MALQCWSVTASAAHRGVWPTAFPTEILEGKWASPYLYSSLTQAELGTPRPVETPTGVCLPSFLSGGKGRFSRLLREGSWESPLLVLYFLHCVAVPRIVGGVEGQAGAARPELPGRWVESPWVSSQPLLCSCFGGWRDPGQAWAGGPRPGHLDSYLPPLRPSSPASASSGHLGGTLSAGLFLCAG